MAAREVLAVYLVSEYQQYQDATAEEEGEFDEEEGELLGRLFGRVAQLLLLLGCCYSGASGTCTDLKKRKFLAAPIFSKRMLEQSENPTTALNRVPGAPSVRPRRRRRLAARTQRASRSGRS